MGSNEIEIEDVDNMMSSNQTNSFKALVMEQYKRCCTEGSKEMTVGGMVTRMINGQKIEMMMPNQIQIYINTVEHLRILLDPKIQFHGKYGKLVNTINKKTIALNRRLKKEKEGIRDKYNKLSDKREQGGSSEKQMYYQDYIDKLESYKNKHEFRKYMLYKDLLSILSMLLDKLNYFEEESFSA